jgi:hypothetical protein
MLRTRPISRSTDATDATDVTDVRRAREKLGAPSVVSASAER